jgi:hypothetical protein
MGNRGGSSTSAGGGAMVAMKFERMAKIERFDGRQKGPPESDEVEVKLGDFAR